MSNKLIEAVKTLDYKDLAKRALWTFVQAFLGVTIVAFESIIDLVFLGDWTGSWALILATAIAGLAAGLSALKTLIVGVVRQLKEVA